MRQQLEANPINISNSAADGLRKNKRANALKEVKRLCKEFGLTAGMLKGALAKGRGDKRKFILSERSTIGKSVRK